MDTDEYTLATFRDTRLGPIRHWRSVFIRGSCLCEAPKHRVPQCPQCYPCLSVFIRGSKLRYGRPPHGGHINPFVAALPFALIRVQRPMTLYHYLLVPVFGLALSATAQTGIRIVDPTALVLNPDLGNDRAAQTGMQAAGLDPALLQKAGLLGDPARWPTGLRTDSARMANKAALRNYTAYLICEYAADDGARSIVSVPAMGNYHMPDDLRANEDFYLVLRTGGTETIEATVMKPPASKGPAWKNLRPAKILAPEQVFATYDLTDDPEALATLEKQGLSKPEIDAVVFRAHERNWPDGIDSFDERFPKLANFKKYKAYRLAHWADKVLLVIPAEANKKIPEAMRPVLDIYMVFNAVAVEVKK